MILRNKIAAQAGLLLDDEVAPGSIAERRDRLTEPHVRDLEDWVQDLTSRTGEAIPSFDPRSGGVRSSVLVLREEPRCLAGEKSGFVSIDNNDLAAQHTSIAHGSGGLDYGQTVHWNVVPWWVQNPETTPVGGRRTLLAQARRARQDLLDVLDLLPGIRVVVLLGKQTERAWSVVDPGGYDVVTAPHPSPLAWHQMSVSGVRNSALTINAFSRAAATIAD
ncbi:hypothetical protein [Aeromicrobium sp. NPDC092404]|uniref:hypothetical protein n=1 Tax=Aeromicrobium sp. NPDC092404 TaxID=3154976 RepID=UPI003423B19A